MGLICSLSYEKILLNLKNSFIGNNGNVISYKTYSKELVSVSCIHEEPPYQLNDFTAQLLQNCLTTDWLIGQELLW